MVMTIGLSFLTRPSRGASLTMEGASLCKTPSGILHGRSLAGVEHAPDRRCQSRTIMNFMALRPTVRSLNQALSNILIDKIVGILAEGQF